MAHSKTFSETEGNVLLSAESLNFVSSPIIKELVPAAMKNTFNKQNDSVHPVF
jgi:hypothetical protein